MRKKVERSKHGVGKGERGERAELKKEEVEKRGGGIFRKIYFPQEQREGLSANAADIFTALQEEIEL
jgi:hypothetical protein